MPNLEVRVLLAANENGPSLDFYDESQKPRLSMDMLSDHIRISLISRDQKVRADLSEQEGGASLSLGDGVVLTSHADEPTLSLTDENGFKSVIGRIGLETARTGEESRTSAASVTLFGKDAKVIWRAP